MKSAAVRMCVVACLVALPARSFAASIAYDVPLQAGNQTWSGSLGMDFNVLSPIYVDRLGVFDSGGNGFAGRMTATLYDRGTHAAIASAIFGQGTPGMLVNGSRFLDLASPVLLPAGFQGSIVAFGYGAAEPNGNLGCNPLPAGGSCLANDVVASALNGGAGLIQFVGSGRYAPPGNSGFPNTIDGGPVNRYLAGTFSYAAVPEPGSLVLFGLGAILLAKRLRRQS